MSARDYNFWFCVGSQDLYGEECLRKVAEHARIMVEEINASTELPFPLVPGRCSSAPGTSIRPCGSSQDPQCAATSLYTFFRPNPGRRAQATPSDAPAHPERSLR